MELYHIQEEKPKKRVDFLVYTLFWSSVFGSLVEPSFRRLNRPSLYLLDNWEIIVFVTLWIIV